MQLHPSSSRSNVVAQRARHLARPPQAATDTGDERFEAFFTRTRVKTSPVSLWFTPALHATMPMFDGEIDHIPVTLRLQDGSRGRFFTVTGPPDGQGDQPPTLGTANVIRTADGLPRLVINLASGKGNYRMKRTVWASVSKRLSDAALRDLGMAL
ncbi:MAG: hypothetical protein JWQ11_607 [Rhizobacter sp.]|nr:hypothetical protein [Rhizobacter sp.]